MKLTTFFLGICATMLASCVYDVYDNRLTTINKTGQKIAVATYQDSFPEYLYLAKKEYYLEHTFYPNDSTHLRQGGKEGWINYVNNSPNVRLNLVIFNQDDLEKYSTIDSLIAHRAYRKMAVGLDDLKKNKWRVVVE